MEYLEIQNLELDTKLVKLDPKKYIKWRWLHKKMMKVLDWLSDYDNRLNKNVVTRTVIERDKISELCLESFYQVYRDTGRPPKILIIGEDKWFELVHDNAFNWSGLAPINIRINDRGHQQQFNGIPVQVVPYINGAFCLPDIS